MKEIVNRILDVITNVIRSIPFLILLILVIPVTRFIVGQSYGQGGERSALSYYL